MAKQRNDYAAIRPYPSFLSDPAVMVQAWKKAHAYVRSHNWYADSLELDMSAIRLRRLIREWTSLLSPDAVARYRPDPMRLVAAPKSTEWSTENGWKPSDQDGLKLRPLAHLSIRDQTFAMVVLICLADIVETRQGDPRLPLTLKNQKKVVSYGHRLVTRWNRNVATFQWGNAKLFRQYFQDYQQFVRRPEKIRQQLFPEGVQWAIVQIDLSQFYDRIPREALLTRLEEMANENPGHTVPHRRFFKAVERLFDWHWHTNDVQNASALCRNEDGNGLPQGLAASGFFANAYLLDFDQRVVGLFGKRIKDRTWKIMDYCRYVDDMRFVVALGDDESDGFRSEFPAYIQQLLDKTAPGLLLNKQKTQVMFGNDHSSNVPVADAMQAVTENVSGPLDVETARHALEMLDGLLAVSNSRRGQSEPTGTGQNDVLRRILSVEPDVRNDSLERFVAHRWRKVYRSLRVMADAESFADSTLNVGRQLLDQRAKTFSVELLRKWILDPSNVRLLRVSLDLLPSDDHLQIVLDLLRSHLSVADPHDKCRLTAEYVAAEVLRAGATETGFVRDEDELPAGCNLAAYRQRLATFATEMLEAADTPRWYLRQQALLLLAVLQTPRPDLASETLENRHYSGLHHLLQGNWPRINGGKPLPAAEAVPLCVVAYRISSGSEEVTAALTGWLKRVRTADARDHIGDHLMECEDMLQAAISKLPARDRDFLTQMCSTAGYFPRPGAEQWTPTENDEGTYRLLDIISGPENPFRQETAALRLLYALSDQWDSASKRKAVGDDVLSPARILITCRSWKRLAVPVERLADATFQVKISPAQDLVDERFRVPAWCHTQDRWKQEVGQVLRAAILGKADYSQNYCNFPVIHGIQRYSGVSTTWFKRRHGLFNDRHGLGSRYLPISPWMAELLGRLLEWPGIRPRQEDVRLPASYIGAGLRRCLDERITELASLYCRLTDLPLYPFPVPNVGNGGNGNRLKVALVQTAIPKKADFQPNDPQLNDPQFRRLHRRHLAALLRLFIKTIDVRRGYKGGHEPIDLVLFPELAVHPDDVYLLVRFADSLKCMVFCGTVFHPAPYRPDLLVNSGLWILPVRTTEGRSIRFVEQGKWHLTPDEVTLGITPYRPCQWLIEYRGTDLRKWCLSAAICYDATDLRLAADLREQSDAFIVSALNRDIGTFDAMVGALHYHMYQHVIVVNTAEFGGSTAQAPYTEPFRKVLVHHHGLDQPLVSVTELDLGRFRHGVPNDEPKAKHPPAGVRR
jgi:hypothetical protein